MEESNDSPNFAGCCDWKQTVEDLTARTANLVRDEPAKAVGFALLGGVLLTVLPVGRVLSALVRLAFSLARPALLVFGAMKLYDEFSKQQKP